MFKSDAHKLSPLRILWFLSIVVFLTLLLPVTRYFFFSYIGRWVYILLFSFTLSALLTPLMRTVALKFNIVDLPGGRKIHEKSTPLLGGVAIIISFISALTANMILDGESVVLLLCAVCVALVSLIDDWRGLSAKFKLITQILFVLILIQAGIILELFPIKTTWGYSLNFLLTIFWIVGITNSLNFIDGMDGLAAGISAIIAFFLGIVAFQTYQPYMGWIAVAMVGSCLGFLPYNFRPNKPAAIFLGDTGSIFLGFVLSALAVKGEWSENNPVVSFSAPLLIFWILIFDMTYITVERILTGKVRSFREWLDYVGKDHIHHRLYSLLGDRRKAVLFIYFLCATLGVS
ncbi:MAG: undecaprenyl/decaprenyl-phosphate alpha-N-acetylglucosaminyl 1-phosphate transferase, partial [Deltaproteobacteria bacterium]|nr:undecaprenyl/decaprenyl-phosphate alpha-N-acetylglucosaminyl 1-phosphate transferase [Deltaproteobacteria bacterium]